MKKIGITTITFTKDENVDYNYGNILQNYALTRFLQNNHCEVNTIYYHTNVQNYLPRQGASIQEKKTLLQFVDDVQRVLRRRIFSKQLEAKRRNRRRLFAQFISDHIQYSDKEYYSDSNLSELDAIYDGFVTGSDQVWNPYYEGTNEFFYLGFAKKGKRISYAPSIAVDTIPEEIKEKYCQWIGGIDYLSIREEAGKALLEEQGYHPELVCDPVFLLSKEEWREVVGDKPGGKYFLVYILGKKTIEIKRAIHRLEKELGIKAVDIYRNDDLNSAFAGPNEFLSYIDGAEFVLTNSFHGVAFSIIMDTPIVIMERDSSINMNSRIESILNIVGVKPESPESFISKHGKSGSTYDHKRLDELILFSKQYLLNAVEQL